MGNRIQYFDIRRQSLPQLEQKFSQSDLWAMKAIAHVLPSRSNHYLINELIDWDAVPDDPIFRLTFPHPDMLPGRDVSHMVDLLKNGAPANVLQSTSQAIRNRLNPHPGGQREQNIPMYAGAPVEGIQHKYSDTVLLFPTAGQSCHAYCTFCFRWPQFVGGSDWKFATREDGRFWDYLREHKEVSSVLLTGGDPMTMRTPALALYLEPFLQSDFDHITTIRIGSKSLAYWPHRFVSDPDADDLLRLFEQVTQAGKQLAFMAHYEHQRELDTTIARTAVKRLQATGAVIRTQGPIINHINDNPDVWAQLWSTQVQLGMIPYYQFVERQTGAKEYFELPLAECLDIYHEAVHEIPGLARTVRGPVMSTAFGKVQILDLMMVNDRMHFALSFVRCRHEDWCNQIFLAHYDAKATWLTDLRSPNPNGKFFYESRVPKLQSIPLSAC